MKQSKTVQARNAAQRMSKLTGEMHFFLKRGNWYYFQTIDSQKYSAYGLDDLIAHINSEIAKLETPK